MSSERDTGAKTIEVEAERIIRGLARHGRVYLSGGVEFVEVTARALPDILGVPREQMTEWWVDEALKMEAEGVGP